eukprot:symbB.v1.2.040555.t1/scaffold7331.1/size11881/1
MDLEEKKQRLMELFNSNDSSDESSGASDDIFSAYTKKEHLLNLLNSYDVSGDGQDAPSSPTSPRAQLRAQFRQNPILQTGGAPKKRKADADDIAEERYESKTQRLTQLTEKLGDVKMKVEQDLVKCTASNTLVQDFLITVEQLKSHPKKVLEAMFGKMSDEDVENFIESIGSSKNPSTRFLAVARVAWEQDLQNLKKMKTLATLCEKHIVKMVERILTANFAASNGDIQWSKVMMFLAERKNKKPSTTSRGTGDDDDDDDDPELLPDAGDDDGGGAPKKTRGRRPKKAVTAT